MRKFLAQRDIRAADLVWGGLAFVGMYFLSQVALIGVLKKFFGWSTFDLFAFPLVTAGIPVLLGAHSAWATARARRNGRRMKQEKHRQARIALGHCPSCDYDLTGNTSGVCPECGSAAEGMGARG
jgi:uncharacterized paraquat-inducible protein A